MVHTKQATHITKTKQNENPQEAASMYSREKWNKIWTTDCDVWNLNGQMLQEHISFVICDVLM